MATRIQCRSMSYIQKYEHNHDHTNVDPCCESCKDSITTWGKQWALNRYPGSSSHLPQSMILSMWLQCFDVEHDRNHLITGQWWEPLTSAREITIDVDDSQGTLVQYHECE